MALKQNSFEGGTNGTGGLGTVTTGNSGGANGSQLASVTPGTGGSIEYISSQAFHGVRSVQFTQPTAANLCHLTMSDTASANWSARVYVRITAMPSAELQFPMDIRNSSDSFICGLQMTTAGRLRTVAGSSLGLMSSGSAMSLNTWYRISFWGTGLGTGSGTVNCSLYLGNSFTPIETLSHTGVNLGANQGARCRVGKSSNATLASWQMDAFAVNFGSSSEIGGTNAVPDGWSEYRLFDQSADEFKLYLV